MEQCLRQTQKKLRSCVTTLSKFKRNRQQIEGVIKITAQTIQKDTNNTADTKEGMDGQTFCALIVFQSSYLLFEHFVTFDIVLIRHIG